MLSGLVQSRHAHLLIYPQRMTPDEQTHKEEGFSPKAYLRARRPELFSDSVIEQSNRLDRSILEYHLETLTKRSQETDFEHFARKLAEREICPNLIPHTGPAGGGDSKVDTETFPVADALALTWYIGTGREAAQERWAFAFSAKEDWQAKVKCDIKKIADTKRGYRKAYFLSSRFIPDKLRAQVEDDLRKKHKLDVRILDRSWILDRLFQGRHENLAIEELRLSPSLRTSVRQGAQDLEAERESTEVENRLTQASRAGHFGHQFVTDCIKACKLSRALERPRTETDGRFSRARTAAEKHGTEHQRLLVAYHEAWTSYWWHEDYTVFDRCYLEVEKFAIGTQNPHELELLHNLWIVGEATRQRGDLTISPEEAKRREDLLAQELDRLAKAEGRPSAVLQVRTLRLQQELYVALCEQRPDKADAALKKLKGVLRSCEGLVGFPLAPLVEILTEAAELIGELPAYGDLFETVVEVTRKRDGDISAAQLLIHRGTAQLEAGKSYDAIRTLGRALLQLFKHESRADLVHALGLCAAAYEDVGLLWAARGTMLNAASIATGDFWAYSDVTSLQTACYSRLKWIEARLGRVPHSLAWHEVDVTARTVLARRGHDPRLVWRGESPYNALLGGVLLGADLGQLLELTKMPATFDRLGLGGVAAALSYALGHDDAVPAELREGKSAGQLREFFTQWRDQAREAGARTRPELCAGDPIVFDSRILGCRVTVETQNLSPCTDVAEALLAALESLLSTGQVRDLFAQEPDLQATVKLVEGTVFPFTFDKTDRNGKPHLEITCANFNPHSLSVAEQNQIKDQLLAILTFVLARVFIMPDPKRALTRLFRDERAMERSLNFTGGFVTLGNVLGHQPKHTLAAWLDPQSQDYPLRRTEEWDAADRRKQANAPIERVEAIRGASKLVGEFPEGQIKQSEMETISLIRLPLWDRAKWRGTGFMVDPSGQRPPLLALLYEHGEAGAEIFAQWRQEMGKHDEQERLRVVIIRGVDRQRPHAYRVVVTANLNVLAKGRAKQFGIISRHCETDPTSDQNLNMFIESHCRVGAYFLGHAQLPANGVFTAPTSGTYLLKREFTVRQAWEIGEHDPDSAAIHPDDDPVIPPGQSDAPILAVLKAHQARTKNKR